MALGGPPGVGRDACPVLDAVHDGTGAPPASGVRSSDLSSIRGCAGAVERLRGVAEPHGGQIDEHAETAPSSRHYLQ
jgi:hypothetical protein